MFNKHWSVSSEAEYFHIEGHEWPTLLVEVAKWLVETGVAVDDISFKEVYTDDALASKDHYVCATVYHSSIYSEKPLDPFEDEVDTESIATEILNVLERHGLVEWLA